MGDVKPLKREPLKYVVNDWTYLAQLRQAERLDALWPQSLRSAAGIEDFCQSWDLRTWFREGQVDFARLRRSEIPAGFVTCGVLDASLVPTRAVEIGTYIRGDLRGTGLNEPLKRHAHALAARAYRADSAVYVVPGHNQRAIAAFGKLPFSALRITSNLEEKSWSALWKQLAWKHADPTLELFIVDLR